MSESLDNESQGGFVIQPSEVEDIDTLFELYARKVRELEIISNSLALTERLRTNIGGMFGAMTAQAANDNVQAAVVEVRQLERKIVQQLVRRPSDLHRMEPRHFEELVCALLADMGLEVKLTPATRDGGRDILAAWKTPVGELLTIVECKRYRPDRPVAVREIRSFLYTIRDGDRASCGMLATTSYFSKDAANLAADYVYQLNLKDARDIKQWLERYGTWTQSKSSGFWLPAGPNVAPPAP
ncbi:MAG: restriction endonuclease [Planctomycetota bacterium]